LLDFLFDIRYLLFVTSVFLSSKLLPPVANEMCLSLGSGSRAKVSGGQGASKKSRNEGRTHDVIDNKGPILGTHDVYENK
jgi:hypothetical protein